MTPTSLPMVALVLAALMGKTARSNPESRWCVGARDWLPNTCRSSMSLQGRTRTALAFFAAHSGRRFLV